MTVRNRAGFTLLEIMIVVFIVGLLALITYPAFARARQAAQLTSCLDKLRQIDAAKSQWALENSKVMGDPVAQIDVEPYLKRPAVVFVEPTGGSFSIGPVGTDPECTHFDANLHPATI